ncbi:WD40-repeat-containing domain protein [Mycena sanguinolenta]|nr:WD40-repeat-containing domain protein [Mycena sanguinolenta]
MSYFCLPYHRQRGVESHSGGILVLAITENGKTLATGGAYLSPRPEILSTSLVGAGSRGHTVSLLWARQTEEHHNVLYSGTQNGYFVCWRQDKESKVFEETFAQQITHAGEIIGLAFDSINNRLCLCSRTDVVQSWAISKDANTGMWKATNIFSQKYSNFVPRSITFAAIDNSSDRDIIVFGSGHNGPVYTLRGTSGEQRSQWNVGSYIGGTAVDWSGGVFCVSNPYTGPTLFRHANQTKTRSFEVPQELRGGPSSTDVCFGGKGSTIVTGSDHGKVYVFDIRSGDAIQTLETGHTKRVKAVATTEVGGEPTIIATHSYTDDGFQQIFVWKHAQSPIAWETVVIFLQTLVLIGFLIFVYQNLVGRMWEGVKSGSTLLHLMSTQFESRWTVLGVQSPGNPPATPNTTAAVDHECSCTLQLHPHPIADDEWAAHCAEWKAKKATETAAATQEDKVDPVQGSTVDEKELRGHEERQVELSMKDYEAPGIRWSELAWLPYWDNTERDVADTLNNLPEGLVASWTRAARRGSK